MKVTIVTGSFPPEPCGVGSYIQSLVNSLEVFGLNVEVFHSVDWKIRSIASQINKIQSTGADIIHLQYPTQGFKRYFTPLFLPILIKSKKTVTTLHEFSRFSKKGKLKMFPLGLSDYLIFTTELERSTYSKMEPWVKIKSCVIPIGSSIPLASSGTNSKRRTNEVIYFGLLTPDKGIEEFLELVNIARKNTSFWRFTIIGSFPDNGKDYAEYICVQAQMLGIDIFLNRSNDEVAVLLAQASWAYLPFPDGPSERRTTLLSSLKNGLNVLTTPGSSVPKELIDVLWFAQSPLDAFNTLEESTRMEDKIQYERMLKGIIYAKRFSWNYIALEHIKIYDKLIVI